MEIAARARRPAGNRSFTIATLTRRPAAVLAIAAVLTAVLALGFVTYKPLGLQGLQTDASVDLLADPGSPAFADQVLFANSFGADPLVIEVEAQPGKDLLTGDHFIGLAALEGDIAGRPGVKKVYGPGTVVNELALEVTKRGLETCAVEAQTAQAQAVKDAAAQGKSQTDQAKAGQAAFDTAARACAQRLAAQYPTLGLPALNNPAFIGEVLLEPGGATTRPYWTWALPDPRHALITVRLDRHATLSQVRAVLARVDKARHKPAAARAATPSAPPGAPTPTTSSAAGLSTSGDLSDLKLTASGSPVLAASLADAVQVALLRLLPVTLLVMLAVSFLVLRVPLRLLVVPLAALAAFWTAGAAGLLRLPFTPATLAVLPIVLGLSTDYTLQALNRLADEEGGPVGRVTRTAAAILPPTAIAALATIVGVLAFALSPIPLVRQFALFLAIGVVMAYLAGVLVGIPLFALVLSSELRRFLARPTPKPSWPLLARLGRAPLPLVLPLLLAGALGWAALPAVQVETDPIKLMPAGSAAVADADYVRRSVGLAGELDLVLLGPAVASPEAIAWLDNATGQAVKADGSAIKPETSLASFLKAFNQGNLPDRNLTEQILQRLPPYFTGAVLDTKTGASRSVFALTRFTSVQEDGRLVAGLRGVDKPPPGYRAYPAGLSVVASDSLAQLRADELRLNLLALGLVLLVVGIAYRRPLTAVLAVVPAFAAAGWATGTLYLSHQPASPITILLAGVVVAFATEFSVLWLARYAAELKAGATAAAAAALASTRVGPAIVASALALGLGFGVLAVSDVPMVRDFGLWSAADLFLATAAVLVLLPPLARRFLRPAVTTT